MIMQKVLMHISYFEVTIIKGGAVVVGDTYYAYPRRSEWKRGAS